MYYMANSELPEKFIPYYQSKQLHAQQVHWQNALLLQLREVKAREIASHYGIKHFTSTIIH